ncbi:MAG: peptide chain release factor N(5)-glutamine methyltransferase [Proteobacteria bacterium]|nr:peptide chain release factor N(5)-glutamine methyltransferase [Pseudomonadota bacterium]
MTSIAAALAEARDRIPGGEARLLLRQVLGCTAAYLEAHRDEELPAESAAGFAELTRRREAGEPIAYLTGVREFFGHEFAVTTDVLIPRPETELLVELGIAKLANHCAAPEILDLGSGSGCVAVSLALELSAAQVTALDVSAAALLVAQHNAQRHRVALDCIESDWFAALDGLRYDLIVANPPYIAAGDMHLRQGDLRFEPRQALVSGVDGLDAIRHIVNGAARHLSPGGWLLFEHGYDQAAMAGFLLQQAGYVEIEQHRDLAGIVRVSGGRSTPAIR